VPVFVVTGGNPLKRPDVFELVQYATDCNVRISLTPGPAPLLTRDSIVRLKECGSARLAVSLDGPTAAIHDGSRRVPGSYQWTIDAVRWAREIGLPVQRVFAKLYETSTLRCQEHEAQHYRRYLLHRRTEGKRFGEYPSETHQRFPQFIEFPVSTATDAIGRTPRGLTVARASSSSRMWVRFIPADSCRSPAATFAVNPWPGSTATFR